MTNEFRQTIVNEHKDEIIKLCSDFITQGSAVKITTLSCLLERYVRVKGYKKSHIRDITFHTTEIITFLAQIWEKIEGIEKQDIKTTQITQS